MKTHKRFLRYLLNKPDLCLAPFVVIGFFSDFIELPQFLHTNWSLMNIYSLHSQRPLSFLLGKEGLLFLGFIWNTPLITLIEDIL